MKPLEAIHRREFLQQAAAATFAAGAMPALALEAPGPYSNLLLEEPAQTVTTGFNWWTHAVIDMPRILIHPELAERMLKCKGLIHQVKPCQINPAGATS